MAMSLKFVVEEDFSEGLDKLQKRVSKDMEQILSEMMFRATGRMGDDTAPIPRRLMDKGEYNPYLFMSAQDKSYWTYDIGEEQSSVIANYSGMDNRPARPPEDEFMVWWEFAEEYYPGMPDNEWFALVYATDPTDRTLDRDYAFYQETGADKVAKPEYAHHIGFINRGLGDAANQDIPYALNAELTRILNML